MSNITGRLINARRTRQGVHTVLTGEIYEDIHERFYDGQVIRTSPIVSEEGMIVLTANSIYEIESWAA